MDTVPYKHKLKLKYTQEIVMRLLKLNKHYKVYLIS
jgi:hypothetical protein